MKPKVLQFVGSFNQGGSERQAVQVTRLLHESDRYHVNIACLEDGGVLRPEVEHLGFDDIPAFPLTSFYDLNTATQLRRFVGFLRERKIDVIQSYDFYTNVFGMAAAGLARVPVRIAARRETDGVKTAGQKWVERRAFQLADVIVTNADAVKGQLIRDGVPARKLVTIYNGMDTKRVAPRPQLDRAKALAALNLPVDKERRFVTIVANMRHAMKDQPTFLRAAQRVYAAVPEAAFILAGEGELMDQMRSLAAQLGLQDNTFFTGRCANVSDLLAISDVCVLSSRGVEGFSNSIIEYMAAARPVVATDIGGAREAVVDGETGYIVPPGDDEMMATRIIVLLRDRKRALAMGELGLRVVKEKFSCEVQLARIQDLYSQLLGRRKQVVESSADYTP